MATDTRDAVTRIGRLTSLLHGLEALIGEAGVGVGPGMELDIRVMARTSRAFVISGSQAQEVTRDLLLGSAGLTQAAEQRNPHSALKDLKAARVCLERARAAEQRELRAVQS